MRTLPRAIVPFIAVATAGALAPSAGRNEAAPPRSVQGGKSTTTPAKSEPQGQPTAEDVLKALQRRRPVNEVIPPGSRAARDAVTPHATASQRLLMPEGLFVVGRTGRLAQEGRWWIFAFDDDESLPPLKLLPNANLELMVRTLRGASGPIRFTVSGELTVFDGENLLLPSTASRAGSLADGAGSTAPSRSVEENGDPAQSPVRPRPDASAEDVLAALRAKQPNQAILPLAAPGFDEDAPQRPGGFASSSMLDGSPVVNRVGRLVRQGSWWTFVSDSDRPDHSEPPLRLLPNQGLERMLQESQRGNRAVFLVSGEVTLFEGENYLLTRITSRRVDTGNLRK